MSSQSLSEYQWENRLVIILTENESSEKLSKQLKIFEKNINGLKDRKLMILHSTPKKQREIFPEESGWQDSKLYQEMKESQLTFEIVLIGLDGGVKLRQTEVLETKKLFDLIDSMPMRKAEIQNKND